MNELEHLKKAAGLYKLLANVNFYIMIFFGLLNLSAVMAKLPVEPENLISFIFIFLLFWMNKNNQLKAEEDIKRLEDENGKSL